MFVKKRMLLCLMMLFVFTLTACSPAEKPSEINPSEKVVEKEKTVTVKRGDITPTVSEQTTIIPAAPFVIFSEEKGLFYTSVNAEDKIAAGQVIGSINGKVLKSPVGGTVISTVSSEECVPSHYPLVVVQYTGFALNVEAGRFLSALPTHAALKARFQVQDGVGPTEALAVVFPITEGKEEIAPKEGALQCLIDRKVDVKSGQSATVVITAQVRQNVLLLPLSVVAGRQGKGVVTVITSDGKRTEKEVVLGVQDGANIEILAGIKEGDRYRRYPRT